MVKEEVLWVPFQNLRLEKARFRLIGKVRGNGLLGTCNGDKRIKGEVMREKGRGDLP